MTHAGVMKMVEGLDKEHQVYVDNFYTSPDLFCDLRADGFGACGSVAEAQHNEQMVGLWSPDQQAMLGLEFYTDYVVPKILVLPQWPWSSKVSHGSCGRGADEGSEA